MRGEIFRTAVAQVSSTCLRVRQRDDIGRYGPLVLPQKGLVADVVFGRAPPRIVFLVLKEPLHSRAVRLEDSPVRCLGPVGRRHPPQVGIGILHPDALHGYPLGRPREPRRIVVDELLA